MAEKRILIVDDEAVVRSVLQKALSRLGQEYEVVTAPDGMAALKALKAQSFDLVVTDYRMAGLDGIGLLKAIHSLQSQARVILMTAYGSDALETEARRLQAYRYLTKPFEIDGFRKVVREALEDIAVSRPGILILSDERYLQVDKLLTRLRADIGARCIVLTNDEGHMFARVGEMKDLPLEQIASLVSGSVASLLEAGRAIDGDADCTNLAYREGRRENLYVVNVGRQMLLVAVIESGRFTSRLGSVWYYARQAVQTLRQELGEAEYARPTEVLSEDLGRCVGVELDKLLGQPTDAVAGQDRITAHDSGGACAASLLSFDEAVRRGLVPGQDPGEKG